MLTTPPAPPADRYAGVALGVECAWPLPTLKEEAAASTLRPEPGAVVVLALNSVARF